MFSNQFVGVQTSGEDPSVVAVTNEPGASNIFKIVRKSDDTSRVRIQAPNGLYLQVRTSSYYNPYKMHWQL